LERMDTGQCMFKILEADNDPILGLNFLTKVATHFTRSRIGFCDPASM
jgi:hypothetical protein